MSWPEPRTTVTTAVAALPAGSVTVRVTGFDPSARARTTEKLPDVSAAPTAVCPLAALRALIEERACVLPTIVTDVPLTVDLSAGEAIVIFGFAVSRT